jgi:hypothetical protein
LAKVCVWDSRHTRGDQSSPPDRKIAVIANSQKPTANSSLRIYLHHDWYNNKTFPLAFTDAGVQAAKAHELRLEPGK